MPLSTPLKLTEERQRHHAGVVHHHVDASETRDRRRDQRPHVVDRGHVGPDRDRLATRGGDRGGRLPHRLFVDVGADELRAACTGLRGQQTAEARARAGSGDDDDLVPDVIGCAHEVSRWNAAKAGAV